MNIKTITDEQLLSCFLEQNYKDKYVILWIEDYDWDVEIYLSKYIDEYFTEKVPEWTLQEYMKVDGECVFIEVNKDTFYKLKNAAFEDKWGVGSCVYLWSDNNLAIGRD